MSLHTPEQLAAEIYERSAFETTIFYYPMEPLWEAVADTTGADIPTKRSVIGQGKTLNEALLEIVQKLRKLSQP